MIAHERCPSLPGARWRRELGHVARNGDFGNHDPELEKLAVNSRSAPTHVHLCHLRNQLADFDRNTRPASTTLPALPSPEELEALTMPSQNCGWLHHCQASCPATPETRQQYPENTVSTSKPGPRLSTAQARELMTQCHVLGDKICTPLKDNCNKRENQRELDRHPANDTLIPIG